MTTLQIQEKDIPELNGKTAVITGGSSGIGWATAKILASKGAQVYIFDRQEPTEPFPSGTEYIYCDISLWSDIVAALKKIGPLHIAVANAGVSEEGDYLTDSYDENGDLIEPTYKVIDVNLRGTLNFVKLALNNMKKNRVQGSIVITSSATAYSAEQSLPVYSAMKAALINYMRAMRSTLQGSGITINSVAPAATITKLLPPDLAAPIIASGLPVSSAHFVGLAVAYSATASEHQKVQAYGKDTEKWKQAPGRWNGRAILTLGERYTELEGSISDSRPLWFGKANLEETRMQQAATDFREFS
ncbi:short chain dehydrogenase reductase [Dactylonectria macrodidyma]|uniref:Short chain dehydrogenase reductase n=1 Tax=Dactylonectria macrodidyma TaxID=307937 RepID=A0A9P9EQZ5_9HYPO|nr:short chain dehydrogenase reductase [Dactylonectria macrodidyma]